MSARYDLLIAGAGSWGTALALQAARSGRRVALWGRDPQQVSEMAEARENRRYLPDAPFPDSLNPVADLEVASRCELVMIATPSEAFAATLMALRPHLRAEKGLSWATKGFEHGTGRFLHEVAKAELGDVPMALLTGPSFAREVANNAPTLVTVAATELGFAKKVARCFHYGFFRTYTSTDLMGASVGGAVKNVLAVATGIGDGMGLGTNARAALITRGLAEMMRLADALDGERETLMGLSGVGDLVLTCTGDLSRNRRFGLALGKGADVETAIADIGQVVEGAQTAREVVRLARKLKVEMPISEEVCRVIDGELTPTEAVEALLARAPRTEFDLS